MTDIQKARDVLAKWRDGDTMQWHIDPSGYIDDADGNGVTGGATEGDARLIVGTAGNPDLLDAIDALFNVWARAASWGAREFQVDEIAAAIIAANERMQQ